MYGHKSFVRNRFFMLNPLYKTFCAHLFGFILYPTKLTTLSKASIECEDNVRITCSDYVANISWVLKSLTHTIPPFHCLNVQMPAYLSSFLFLFNPHDKNRINQWSCIDFCWRQHTFEKKVNTHIVKVLNISINIIQNHWNSYKS